MFHLHCDPLHSAFTLCQEGETWRLTFDSFEEAYDQAETCTADEAHLVLHNASGSVVCQTTISPLEPALLQARVHWKDVANAEITDGGQLTVVARG